MTLGEHYFETAVLLRESLFLNLFLTNGEVWYGMTKEEINKLEDLDISLLRRLLGVPLTVAKEALYLELGCTNIGEL